MKKTIKIILVVVAAIVILGTIFGIVDYNRAKNGETPIFIYRNKNISVEGELVATEYYGFGYKINVCKMYCGDKEVFFFPFNLGTYAWFIGSDYINNIKVIETSNCDNKAKLYYSEGDIKIYTYCLDNVEVNESIQLNDYINNHIDVMDFIINNFTEDLVGPCNDGGSVIYSGVDFNILKCNTVAGNKDIYIGTKDMNSPNGFCND